MSVERGTRTQAASQFNAKGKAKIRTYYSPVLEVGFESGWRWGKVEGFPLDVRWLLRTSQDLSKITPSLSLRYVRKGSGCVW